MEDIFLKIEDLNFAYTKELILKNINLVLYRGDFVAIIGSNGSGKSTLIKILTGQLKKNSGTIKFYDENVKIGYVPQLEMSSSLNFPIKVYELVSLSLYEELKGFKKIDSAIEEKIFNALFQVGMEDFYNSLYSQLSGGQRQRALIAKALVANPNFLLLDEPTNGVDHESKINIYKLLNHLSHEHKITILMITHEIEDAKEYLMDIYKLQNSQLERCVL
ncbi:ABC transporter, ATP-binding protein [Peptoniphilus sp. ING2-D1G]|nr:ABC transporter, ATP-binding protein [Peptoniphilus sp. ING2-D1G]